ncbi:MAG: putative colanic acid biosynthesis acetyltransferase [Bacteroidota bacterium]
MSETQTKMQHKTDLSLYNNSWFKPGAGKLKQVMWYFTNVLFFINPLNPSSGIKVFLLRLFSAQIGKGVVIKPSVNIKYPWKLKVGDHSWIGEKVWIDNLAEVEIASNCCISQGAMLLTGNHNFRKTTFDLITKGIILEEGAWIGAFAIVCPGVTVMSHAVLAVNSVATETLQPYSVYKGNPALLIRERIID